MKSQNQEILDQLKQGKRITNAIAFHHMRITRLSARIYELRQQGYRIAAEPVKRRSKRTGRLVRYYAYYLEAA